MTLKFKRSSSSFRPVPAGLHPAICTIVADLGIQGGGKFDPAAKVYIAFELVDEPPETYQDRNGHAREAPKRIGQEFTNSMSPKGKLRPFIETWRGKLFTESEIGAFDFTSLLGKPCMLGVVHGEKSDGGVYAKIASVLAPPLDRKIEAKGKFVAYDLSEPDPEMFDQLPKWIQQKIRDRLNMPGREKAVAAHADARADSWLEELAPAKGATAIAGGGELDDEIPF